MKKTEQRCTWFTPTLGLCPPKRVSHLVTLDSLKVTIHNNIIAVNFLLLRAFTIPPLEVTNCIINAAIQAAPFTGSNLIQPRPLWVTEILFIITNRITCTLTSLIATKQPYFYYLQKRGTWWLKFTIVGIRGRREFNALITTQAKC